jgi:hypothetical protein
MKAMRLDLEALTVETFATTLPRGREGESDYAFPCSLDCRPTPGSATCPPMS